MNAATPITLQPDTAAQAATIAEARGQSLDAFVNQAVADALAEFAAFETAMDEAEQDLDAGRAHDTGEVLALLSEMRAKAEDEISRRNNKA